jgi:short-subunit dehydrogenase involved in D-alanine esterification of teichoic acids
MLPGYSASKAALCSFILTLREQLASKNIKVIEIMPPPVQSMSCSFSIAKQAR